jgi:hypothetical protein
MREHITAHDDAPPVVGAIPENLYAAYSGALCLRRTGFLGARAGWARPINKGAGVF